MESRPDADAKRGAALEARRGEGAEFASDRGGERATPDLQTVLNAPHGRTDALAPSRGRLRRRAAAVQD